MLLPFIYLVATVVGLTGLVSVPAGLWVRAWVISTATSANIDVTHPREAPALTGIIVGLGLLLLVWGLAGLHREGRREAARDRLLEQAESIARTSAVPREPDALPRAG